MAKTYGWTATAYGEIADAGTVEVPAPGLTDNVDIDSAGCRHLDSAGVGDLAVGSGRPAIGFCHQTSSSRVSRFQPPEHRYGCPAGH